ncbi:glycosyltransferase [Alphaproteobacteria bacterium]|nr:glycosyltransferase [Alphaproteobacteria bacterium]
MIKNFTKNRILDDLTIVIPTIGENALFTTLDSIYKSEYIAKEILISIPELMLNKNINNSLKKYKRVRVLKTAFAGQVLQRIEGFKQVSTKLVLQLDSDIELNPKDLKTLYDSILKKGSKSSVGVLLIPQEIDITNNKFNEEPSNFNIRSLYYFLIDGSTKKKPGKVYKSGAVEQFFSNKVETELLEVDWLPGGCSIHWTKNLILENYFPFNGKAYCEDVLHSHEIQKKGIKLWVNSKIIKNTEILSYIKLDLSGFLNFFINDYQARSLVVKRMNLSYVRMMMFYIIILVNYFISFFLVTPIKNFKRYLNCD